MSRTLTKIGLSMRRLFVLVLFASGAGAAQAQPCTTDADCDDTLFCNGIERCVNLVCEPGVPPCVDAHACTIDACDEAGATCMHTPDDSACNDGAFCNGVETCDVTLGCRPGTPPCADAIACTIDSCNEVNGTCTNTPDDTACDDGLFCNGVETCNAVNGCLPGTPVNCSSLNDQCNVGVCQEAIRGCVKQPANEGGPCSDGRFCTVSDTCTTGSCGGLARDCADGIACSTDTCSDALGQCLHNPVPNCPDCSGDGVPDLCISTNAVGANWTDDMWGLPGPVYPDNITGVPGLFAELLSPASVTMDIDVLIAGLAVRGGATLLVTGPSVGDITIKSGTNGGVIDEGAILVAGNRAITIPDGPFSVGGVGSYLADPTVGTGTTANLTATDISVVFGGCGMTARMLISEGMTATTTLGNLVLDGTGVLSCGLPLGNAAARGGKTPPIIKVANPTTVLSRGASASAGVPVPGQLNIAGSFQMLEGAEVCIGCGGPSGGATPTVVVNGDFDNQSVLPSFFRWARGELVFPTTGVAHRFEVGGLDLGPDNQGFNTNVDTLFDIDQHTNFSMDTIVLPDGSDVTFENTFANTAGTAPGSEALYVRKLTLGLGSRVTVDGCTVYYCDLTDGGAQFQFLNGGALVAAPCGIPAVSTWGMIALTLLSLTAGSIVIVRRSKARSQA